MVDLQGTMTAAGKQQLLLHRLWRARCTPPRALDSFSPNSLTVPGPSSPNIALIAICTRRSFEAWHRETCYQKVIGNMSIHAALACC